MPWPEGHEIARSIARALSVHTMQPPACADCGRSKGVSQHRWSVSRSTNSARFATSCCAAMACANFAPIRQLPRMSIDSSSICMLPGWLCPSPVSWMNRSRFSTRPICCSSSCRDRRISILQICPAGVADPLADLANSRLEFLWAYGMATMKLFTACYLDLYGRVAVERLAYWDLFAALHALGAIKWWRLESATERKMTLDLRWFVARARERVAC